LRLLQEYGARSGLENRRGCTVMLLTGNETAAQYDWL
jgi:hypothetical protein